MTTPYRKKLIEVALPLEAINVASAREKSIRHGHPSTLHLWWARRPLATCRAVLFASLVDDPDSDPTFRKADGSVDEERAGYRRAELFNLIEELVQWENSNNESVINRARAEIAASVASRKIHDTKEWKKEQTIGSEKAWTFVCRTASPKNVNAFLEEHAPPVLDPFAGGGSIPLEAQRLGLRAFASDLNPVPVLINKALIEIPPKFANMPPVNPDSRGEAGPAGKKGKGKGKSVLGQPEWRGAQGLAEDMQYYGNWVRDEAVKRVGHLYPTVKLTAEIANGRPDLKPYIGEELNVIAWLWARTMKCPNPACGARAPLIRSFWLSTKAGKECFAEPLLDRDNLSVTFRISRDGVPPKHTTDRTGARCLFCDQFVKKAELRAIASTSGTQAIPLAVVVDTDRGRVYLDGTCSAAVTVETLSIPHLEQPMTNDKRWFSPPLYGLPNFSDLFTARQLKCLSTISDLILEVRAKVAADAAPVFSVKGFDDRSLEAGGRGVVAYADAVSTYLAMALDKMLDYNCTLVTWINQRDQAGHALSKQALPMVWDFTEVNPFVGAAGDLTVSLAGISRVVASAPAAPSATVRQLDAAASLLQVDAPLVSTDPPYYDNIGYADLSDFFYVWARRTLAAVYPSIFSTMLTPKKQELIASAHRHDGDDLRAQTFFEEGFGKVFRSIREQSSNDFPVTIFYGFKQSESDDGDDEEGTVETASTGWETMLTGVIAAGFTVDGTWPVRTERGARSVGLGTNALASSIVLSCRPRAADAPLATRREFINGLKRDLPNALKHLQRGSIAPVDLAQASIGPGMAVFTRYAKVMEADGSPMKVRQALALINQTLDEVLAEQEGEFDGDTRWALAWFEQFGMDEGAFGVAETLSKAKNTAINGLVDAGLISARSGKVRLLKRDELPAGWNPVTDSKVRHWEVAQHLIRALECGGETAAADLLRKVGGMGEVARDLAYRLYNLCERKKWASEALAYNGLVIAWPEITKLAQGVATPAAVPQQAEMF